MPGQIVTNGELIHVADECDGNQSAMSRQLGLSRTSINRRLKALNWVHPSARDRVANELSDDEVIRRLQQGEPLPDGFDLCRRLVLAQIAKTQADAALAYARFKITDQAFHHWSDDFTILDFVYQQIEDIMLVDGPDKEKLQEQALQVKRVTQEHLALEYPHSNYAPV